MLLSPRSSLGETIVLALSKISPPWNESDWWSHCSSLFPKGVTLVIPTPELIEASEEHSYQWQKRNYPPYYQKRALVTTPEREFAMGNLVRWYLNGRCCGWGGRSQCEWHESWKDWPIPHLVRDKFKLLKEVFPTLYEISDTHVTCSTVKGRIKVKLLDS